MKYIVFIILTAITIGEGMTVIFAKVNTAPEMYRLFPGYYNTIIISEDTLYYINKRIKTSAGICNTQLLSVPFGEKLEPRSKVLPFGVWSLTESFLHEEAIPIFEAYPFCWDITEHQIAALHIVKGFKHTWPGFELVLMPFEQDLLKNEDLEQWIIGGVDPLTIVFSQTVPDDRKSQIFFDLVMTNENSFDLYISDRGILKGWSFDRTIYSSSLSEQRRLLSYRERISRRKHEWQLLGSWPLEFEGAFRTLYVKGHTYIFSQTSGKLYVPQDDRLEIVAEIPDDFVRSISGGSPPLIIVDKDQDTFFFYAPGGAFWMPFSSSSSTNERDRERLSRIEQAVRSILDSSGSKE